MALDFIRISRLKFAKSEEYHKNKPKAEMDVILCVENPLIKTDTIICFYFNSEIISFSKRQN